MTKDIRKQLRFTESTKKKLTWLSQELGINESAVVDLLISEKYNGLRPTAKEETKMNMNFEGIDYEISDENTYNTLMNCKNCRVYNQGECSGCPCEEIKIMALNRLKK